MLSDIPKNDAHHNSQEDTHQVQPTANDLLKQCQSLLEELEKFEVLYVASQGPSGATDIRPLRNAVASELKSLERLSQGSPSSTRTLHTLRSSNFPFLAAVWSTAKSHTGICAFQRRFYWEAIPGRPRRPGGKNAQDGSRSSKPNRPKVRKRSALVDIVASDGALWIKVSTVSVSRLLFELAKAGWEGSSDSDSDWDGGKVNGLAGPDGHLASLSIQDADNKGKDSRSKGGEEEKAENYDDDSDDDRPELVRTAADIARAAKATRVRYKHPEVLFVLPKLTEGDNAAIDGILRDIRATGARVICGQPPVPSLAPAPASASASASASDPADPLSNLLPAPYPHLTQTVNLDCTILLALVSELSHQKVPATEGLHPAIQRQMTLEVSSPLLPQVLYPALEGKDLVTAPAAEKRMREIVAQIGTQMEVEKMGVLFGDGRVEDEALLREEWVKGSIHGVPEGLRLPVRILSAVEGGKEDMGLIHKEVAERIENEVNLSEVNRGTLWLGWRNGWTTVSSNRAVVKEVERVVDGWLDDREKEKGDNEQNMDGFEGGASPGPAVWIVGVARSLVGKEIGRHK